MRIIKKSTVGNLISGCGLIMCGELLKIGQKIKYQKTYNGYTFTLDAEVDEVQTHNAKDAIKSAWGIDVNVNDDETELSLG